MFLCSLACESWYSKSRYLCLDWSQVGILKQNEGNPAQTGTIGHLGKQAC